MIVSINSSPMVSVIIPVFNREFELSRALNSVVNQTYSNIEILVCDDSSSDNSIVLAKEFQAKDSRIRILASHSNNGPAFARNLGLASAIGEYIAFLDSDDEWLPQKLEKQVTMLERQPLDVGICICGDIIIKNENRNQIFYYAPNKSFEENTLKKFISGSLPFHTPTLFFRKSCLEKVGKMNPVMRVNEDEEFLLRFFSCYKLVVLEESLAIIHLKVSKNKKVYTLLNAALPHKLKHLPLISQQLGLWSAKMYECSNRVNLAQAALREGLLVEFLHQIFCRLKIVPFFFPKEIKKLAKSFVVLVFPDFGRRNFSRKP